MKLAEYLLLGVLGWALFGAIGVARSLRRGRRGEALRHLAWIAAVDGGYLLVLLAASFIQPQRLCRLARTSVMTRCASPLQGLMRYRAWSPATPPALCALPSGCPTTTP